MLKYMATLSQLFSVAKQSVHVGTKMRSLTMDPLEKAGLAES
jgi:hypothetical protein